MTSLSLAVVSLKGGTGKTTVTLGLAGAARARGCSVLVVDLDPQANATAALDVGAHRFSTNDVLADARAGVAYDAVVGSGWGGVDVVPAERALEHRAAPAGRDSTQRLRVALTGVADRYDVVLLDCPPSLGELTRNGLAAARGGLVVTEPGYFALAGAEQALEAIEVVRATANLGLRTAGIVVNRERPHTAEHAFRVAELAAAHPDLLLRPAVPDRAAVQQAQGAGVPVQAWRSPGARAVTAVFETLLDTLVERAGGIPGARPPQDSAAGPLDLAGRVAR